MVGGPEGIRTLDLCVANAALSQLSYGPIGFFFSKESQQVYYTRKKEFVKGVSHISVP